MHCRYTLTEQDVVTAMQTHGRGSNKTLFLLVVTGLIVATFIGVSRNAFVGVTTFLGGVVGYFAVLYLLIPFRARTQYKQLRPLRNELSLTVLDDGICITSESGESRLQWSDIHHWKIRSGIILLYVTNSMFHLVPTRSLDDEEHFTGLLVQKIGQSRK